MRLQDVMTPSPECIGPDESVMGAAVRMRDLNVGSLPICEDGRLIGMVTDRDIAIRAAAEGRPPGSTPVRDIASWDPVWCYADQEVDDGARRMEDRQVRRLPILDRDQRLVGVVSLGDLAVRTDSDKATAETLERISEPSAPNRAAA